MGIALAAIAAWLALAIAWARFRRARAGPSSGAADLVSALRRAPPSERARLAARGAEGSWERSLGLEVERALSGDERVEAIDASLAQLEADFDGSRAWDRVVPRVALLGGLLAASVSVIRGGLVHALVAAGIGAVAGGVGLVLTRAAGAREALQRARADEIAQLLAGGRAGPAVSEGVGRGLGLDRKRRRG